MLPWAKAVAVVAENTAGPRQGCLLLLMGKTASHETTGSRSLKGRAAPVGEAHPSARVHKPEDPNGGVHIGKEALVCPDDGQEYVFADDSSLVLEQSKALSLNKKRTESEGKSAVYLGGCERLLHISFLDKSTELLLQDALGDQLLTI